MERRGWRVDGWVEADVRGYSRMTIQITLLSVFDDRPEGGERGVRSRDGRRPRDIRRAWSSLSKRLSPASRETRWK